MSNYLRRAKNRIKSKALPYYFRSYKHISNKSYPEFLIIGALKSGTTSLYQYLNNHSQLTGSSKKETNFFSWEYNKGIKYYLEFFPFKQDSKGQLIFESCPHYLADPLSASRIKKILPNVKLIAILRDPIERAVSNYNYFSNSTSFFGLRNPNDIDKRSVNQALLDDIQGKESRIFRQYCRLSLYGKQLEAYYRRFRSNEIMVLDFDEFKTDTRAILKKISEFLEIDNQEFTLFQDSSEKIQSNNSFDKKEEKSLSNYNAQNYSLKIDQNIEEQLIEFYMNDIEKLQELSGIGFKWSAKYL